MKERPILMSAPMVRAILDGSKTQTRRVIQKRSKEHKGFISQPSDFASEEMIMNNWQCPYGQPGDRLWVRETWQVHRLDGIAGHKEFPNILYAADQTTRLLIDKCVWKHVRDTASWRPSIHMPRWASRITLEITGIRVERLQDISEEDAEAEGIEGWNVATGGDDFQDYWRNYAMTNKQEREGMPHFCGDMRASFRSLWESINGAGSWALNPWVFVVDFLRVSGQ